jgi:hypothetical protein
MGKSKIFFNYARYQLVLPLDAAIRQLGNEQDDTNFYFTPQADASGNAVLDDLGAVIPMMDAAHVLNGLPGKSATAAFGAPNFASSTGEGIIPERGWNMRMSLFWAYSARSRTARFLQYGTPIAAWAGL